MIVGDYTLSVSKPIQIHKDHGRSKVKYRRLYIRKAGTPGNLKVVAYKDGVPEYYHRALIKAARLIEQNNSENANT